MQLDVDLRATPGGRTRAGARSENAFTTNSLHFASDLLSTVIARAAGVAWAGVALGAVLVPDPGFLTLGEPTRRLIAELEAIVMDAGGALYPAKDALMSPQAFRRSYPRWESMRSTIDPAFSSQFWRRVTANA